MAFFSCHSAAFAAFLAPLKRGKKNLRQAWPENVSESWSEFASKWHHLARK
jgi:hypothetical protein